MFRSLRKMVQDVFGHIHEVVKIQCVAFHLAGYIAAQAGASTHLVGDLAAGEHISLDIAVQGFVCGDAFQELLDGFLRAFQAHFVHGLLGNGLGIFLVQYGEGFGEAQPVDFLPQELYAEAVQGAYEVVVISALDHLGNTVSHFCSGLVGESEAEDVGRVYAQYINNVGIAVGEGLGFARTRACNHAYAALGGLYSLPLARIQSLEDVFHTSQR